METKLRALIDERKKERRRIKISWVCAQAIDLMKEGRMYFHFIPTHIHSLSLHVDEFAFKASYRWLIRFLKRQRLSRRMVRT